MFTNRKSKKVGFPEIKKNYKHFIILNNNVRDE